MMNEYDDARVNQMLLDWLQDMEARKKRRLELPPAPEPEPQPERNIMAELFQGVVMLALVYLALVGLHQILWSY
jgi:hypothetical protein